MAEASNAQVQTWANEHTRPQCERLRALLLKMEADNLSIGDIYENLATSPTWDDDRPDAPPHLLVPGDILAINTVSVQLSKILRGGPFATDLDKINAVNDVAAQLPVVFKACVGPA